MAFTVDTPTLNELVPKDAVYTIDWTDDADNGDYTVNLYKGGVFVDKIEDGIGVKTYDWTPDAGRTSGADYTIRVTDSAIPTPNTAESAAFTLYTLHSRSLSETIRPSDGLVRSPNILRAIAETVTPSDAIVRTLNYLRAIAETVLASDTMIVTYITTQYDHFVYHVDFDAWTEFSYIDELRACVLTGGSLTENINLILTNSGTVNKYPGDNTTSTDSVLLTRRYDMQMGILKRLWLDFTGSPTVKTRVYNDAYGSPYYKEYNMATVSAFLRKIWRWVAGGYNRGDSFELHITNADIIKNAVVDVSIIGKGVR